MKIFNILCNSAIVVLFGIRASAQVCSVSSFQSFNAGSNGDTFPSGINVHGVVAGNFSEYGGTSHGFVRSANGEIALFDGPRAYSTAVTGINARGEITGYYFPGENHNEQNGFVRDEFGKITPFGVPGSVDAVPQGINGKGEIVGFTGFAPAFIRAENGGVTTFSVPGAGATAADSINGLGDIAGSYAYGGLYHGFVRTADGAITTFDASSADQNTDVFSINNKGQIAGYYTIPGNVPRGFVREVSGKIAPIEPPGSIFSNAQNINNDGYAVGSYADSNSVEHGYVRDPNGGITPFDPPGSRLTVGWSINDAGEITGYYINADGGFKGFTAKLRCK